MFTGLVETVGRLEQLQRGGDNCRLVVSSDLPTDELSLGESVAVNGVCLTLVEIRAGRFEADVSPETLQSSSLGGLRPGSRVNLERALRLCDRLGGHLVSGHVDGLGKILSRQEDNNAVRFEIGVETPLLPLLVEKGSVAVDGISLTVNRVGGESFSVAVIPHTLARTSLQDRHGGDQVNIETDLLGKYVARLMEQGRQQQGVSLDLLAKHGFL